MSNRRCNKTDRGPVLLGLGANLGNPVRQLAAALESLAAFVEVSRVSSVYRSEPVGLRDQPDFYNLVCAGRCVLEPMELLSRIRDVEARLGRVRRVRDGPRAIDIDILALGDRSLSTPELSLPHPRLHRRAFVLVPLAEIAPQWRHPTLGQTAEQMLASAGPLERIERYGDPPTL